MQNQGHKMFRPQVSRTLKPATRLVRPGQTLQLASRPQSTQDAQTTFCARGPRTREGTPSKAGHKGQAQANQDPTPDAPRAQARTKGPDENISKGRQPRKRILMLSLMVGPKLPNHGARGAEGPPQF